MSTRNELFLSAVDVLQSGRSLDIEGEHGSGRTHLLRRIGDYFAALGWKTIGARGLSSFAQVPLVALRVAGVEEAQDGRAASIAAAVAAVSESISPGRTLIVVDDWDMLDPVSAGVLRTVQTEASVPILSSRLVHRGRHDPVLPTGAFTTTYAMRLPGMGYAELETALESAAGHRIDPATLSRVFAKSGGNVGLAAAVVDAAHRGGTLVVEDGVAHATGSLWTPSLRHMAEVILHPLSRRAVDALEILGLLGPIGIATAVRAVGVKRVSELEDRSFLSVVDVAGVPVVSIRPPLLVEYFRHESRAGRRSELLAVVDDVLADGAALEDGATTPRDAAVFVRLVHDRTRRRTLRAREAWHSAPTLATATALLSALELDGAHDAEELDALVAAARGLDGAERERAEWESARLAERAGRGDAASAVAELRARATTLPREGGLLLGRAAELESTFLVVPERDPLDGVDVSRFSAEAHAAVLRARAFWMLARGLGEQADAVLAHRAALGAEPDPIADALVVVSHLTAERFDAAARLAAEGLAAAQRDLDATLIRMYAFLAALCASMDRRPDDADHILSESAFLGLAAPHPSLSFIGLKTMAAEMAARRGQRALMEQLLAEVDSAGLVDGPLVGQTSGMPYARMAFIEGGPTAAAAACLDAGDALWERGALFSAACCYLEAVTYVPDEEIWARVSDRIGEVRMSGIVRQGRIAEALVRADTDALVAAIAELEAAGRPREALNVAETALAAVGASDSAGEIVAQRDRLRSAGTVDVGIPPVALTRREREIAELVASGLSNAVIAEALVVSVRTVESHVNRLLRKAGVSRRQDVKAFLLAQDALG
ncbi:LuxR C-terminal-related transcriptional regulator [Microbacterium sp.]|uniref:LuxR C-terminal-related transcriptional regulator n=1 Tax=Microbacterium sp. TaxID=51671 RepID=UPI003F7076A4